MLGYQAADVMNKITPADIFDPQEVIARAKALSVELAPRLRPLRGAGVRLERIEALRADLYTQGLAAVNGLDRPRPPPRREGSHHAYVIGTGNTPRNRRTRRCAKRGPCRARFFTRHSRASPPPPGRIKLNVAAERLLGSRGEVMNRHAADIYDPG